MRLGRLWNLSFAAEIKMGITKVTDTKTGSGPAINLVELGGEYSDTTWLISDWDAGQSNLMQWSPDNVRVTEDGAVELTLGSAADGSGRPYQGGEVQSSAVAETGTWSWLAQAPQMQEGAVFGMFLYQEDWQNDPWLEFDFEFVGSDTTKVELNVHMHDANGNHIMLADGPFVVDLGFDAAEGTHLYEVELTGTEAIFTINGEHVATFDASDMPDNTWYSGNVRSFVDLWAVEPGQSGWAGDWNYSGEEMVGRIEGVGLPSDPIDAPRADTLEVVAAPEVEAAAEDDDIATETDDVIASDEATDTDTDVEEVAAAPEAEAETPSQEEEVAEETTPEPVTEPEEVAEATPTVETVSESDPEAAPEPEATVEAPTAEPEVTTPSIPADVFVWNIAGQNGCGMGNGMGNGKANGLGHGVGNGNGNGNGHGNGNGNGHGHGLSADGPPAHGLKAMDGLSFFASTMFEGRSIDVSVHVGISAGDAAEDFAFDLALSLQSISALQESDLVI